MARCLKTNTTLQNLDLSANRITREAFQFLLQGLFSHSGLVSLKVCQLAISVFVYLILNSEHYCLQYVYVYIKLTLEEFLWNLNIANQIQRFFSFAEFEFCSLLHLSKIVNDEGGCQKLNPVLS